MMTRFFVKKVVTNRELSKNDKRHPPGIPILHMQTMTII